MTEKQLFHLVEAWQERLGLQNWTIEPRLDACDGPNYAETRRSMNYDHAVIVFEPWLLTRTSPPEDKDMLPVTITDHFRELMVVHELLHLVTRDYRAWDYDELEAAMGRDTFAVWCETFNRVDEQTVDRLARALVTAWNGK